MPNKKPSKIPLPAKGENILQTETRTLMLVGGTSWGITLDKSMLREYGLKLHDKIGVIYFSDGIRLLPFHEPREQLMKRIEELEGELQKRKPIRRTNIGESNEESKLSKEEEAEMDRDQIT